MRIVTIDTAPFDELAYRLVRQDRAVVWERLPLLFATVDEMPNGIDAIIATSDLQGRTANHENRPGRLLGEAVAEHCALLGLIGSLPPPDRTGIVLAGDFYSREHLDRRGGSGDVRDVWSAFARHFRWVAGVAGNHDGFSERGPSVPEFRRFVEQPRTFFLDAVTVDLDGLRIAGISGVVGNSRKPFRRSEEQFVAEVDRLIAADPDLLIMHDGPEGGPEQRGWPAITRALERCHPTILIRGHAHWDLPLATLTNGSQVLNVDARVVVMRQL